MAIRSIPVRADHQLLGEKLVVVISTINFQQDDGWRIQLDEDEGSGPDSGPRRTFLKWADVMDSTWRSFTSTFTPGDGIAMKRSWRRTFRSTRWPTGCPHRVLLLHETKEKRGREESKRRKKTEEGKRGRHGLYVFLGYHDHSQGGRGQERP